MSIESLGNDVLNKILILCINDINDIENIKHVSKIMSKCINNYTIPYMIGNFFGYLNKDILNMIFIKAYMMGDSKTVSNLRRTCKYINNFFERYCLPSIIRSMNDKKEKILSIQCPDTFKGIIINHGPESVKDIIRNMNISKFSSEEKNGDSDLDDLDDLDDIELPPKTCNLCWKLVKNKIVISSHLNKSSYRSKIYCFKCFLDDGFLAKVTPRPTNPIDTALLYATNYNILRIMSGMGGLSYSN